MSITKVDGTINPRTLERIRVYGVTQPIKKRPPAVSIPKLTYQVLQEQRLTSRDLQILELLYNARPVLSRDQVHRLFWHGRTWRAANARLLKLYEYHLLDRNPAAITVLGSADLGLVPSIAYYLGAVGKKVLAIQRGVEQIDTDHVRSYAGYTAPVMLIHDLCVSEVYTVIWETIRTNPATDMVWVSEYKSIIRNNQGVELVRPDALVIFTTGASANRQRRYIFLEVERNPRADKLRDKIAKYEAAMIEGVWRGWFEMDTFPEVALIMHGTDENVRASLDLIRQHAEQVRWRVQAWPVHDFFAGWQTPG